MKIDSDLKPSDFTPSLLDFWRLSGRKIRNLEKGHDPAAGSPVYTVAGVYTTRGWTDWTQGFQWGSAILQFDATHETEFLEIGRNNTRNHMGPHLTHFGVHDHGFNNISTYGNLLRLMGEGRIAKNPWESRYYALALKCSAAVQAMRWTETADGRGFIYSFNGPHSLFADTIRSLRSLALGHLLGHVVLGENEEKIDLLQRLVHHAQTTAEYAVYYGQNRDAFDEKGRVAHESIFNISNGQYRCPNTQQGYSPFSTWTRGLAWVMCGFAELLEFLQICPDARLRSLGGKKTLVRMMLKTARATCDYYIRETAADGIPYWDTGAPQLHKLGDYRQRPADPFNDFEPVDSTAAAIAAQGLLRLGAYLRQSGNDPAGKRYWQAGLTVLKTLLAPPYLSEDENHQGLLLHSIYHQPQGWDHIPKGHRVASGESSMWGDYHIREVALLVQRVAQNAPYLVFWPPQPSSGSPIWS